MALPATAATVPEAVVQAAVVLEAAARAAAASVEHLHGGNFS